MITRLSITGLAVSRGDRILFERISLGLARGEAVALGGANGAGKTSLLRAIAGLIRPDAGEVVFSDPNGTVPADDARCQALHLIGHQDGLKSARTAWDELLFQVLWLGGTRAGAGAAAERLGLKALLGLETRKLSAGQRRRLALARLIASPRPLWLLDEPLAPLDSAWRADFGAVMRAHLAGGGLILAAAHDPLPIPARAFELGA